MWLLWTRHILHASVIEFIHTATLLHDDVVDSKKEEEGKQQIMFGIINLVF